MFLIVTFVLAMSLVPTAPPQPSPPPQVKVVAVTASSTMPNWKDYTFDASNLIDGRVDTSWQPAKKDTIGVGEWVELDLGAPYEIDHIEIAQGLQKVDPKLGDLFCRNNRFADAYLLFDDGAFTSYWADPSEKISRVALFYRGEELPGKEVRVVTRFIRLVVKWVLEPVDWTDLAIADIRVFGRPAEARPSDPAMIAWDQPGAYPFKAAITEFCAVKLALRKQRHCAMLTGVVAEGRTYAGGLELPPIPVADHDRGKFGLSFIHERLHVRLGLARAANQRWSVTHLTIRDPSGKPVEPAYAELIEPDRQHQNQCWEKLGKVRPSYPPGDYDLE